MGLNTSVHCILDNTAVLPMPGVIETKAILGLLPTHGMQAKKET
jgi:hypothetical protein